MWRAVWVVALAACYSGKPQPGAPCMPELDNCPAGQTCELVAGSQICVAGGGGDPDASTSDSPASDAPGDATAADGNGDAPTFAPWSLVQTRSVMTTSLGFPAIGAGHLIVVAVQTDTSGAATMVADDANNTYVAIANSRSVAPASGLAVEFWYAKNSNAGATRIAAAAPTLHTLTMWEVAGIDAVDPVHTAAHVDSQAASGTPAGPTITTTATGELIVAVAIVDNTVTGVETNSAFTNDHLTFGNGWAHLTSATAPPGMYTARWNQPNAAIYCASAVAFFAGN